MVGMQLLSNGRGCSVSLLGVFAVVITWVICTKCNACIQLFSHVLFIITE